MRHIRSLLAVAVAVTFLLGLGTALRLPADPGASPSSAAVQCEEAVQTTASGTVTASSCDSELASRVLFALDEAVVGVADILDISWRRWVDVVIPATDDELVALVGPGFKDMAGVAIRDDAGQRVVINRVRAVPLSPLELRVLLRHEITHVATRDLTSDTAPLWLVEGFADWVAFQGTGLSLRQAAPLLTPDVDALPTDFSGPARDLSYQQAYSIMEYLASRVGEKGVVELYLKYAPRPSSVLARDGVVDVVGWREFLRARIG